MSTNSFYTAVDMPKLSVAVPILNVSDIDAATPIFEKLGFSVEFKYGEPPFYAGVVRDGVGIHLSSGSPDKIGYGSCYVMLDKVDELWEEIQGKGLEVVEEIGDRPYGMRDFYVKDADGNVVGFGSEISE